MGIKTDNLTINININVDGNMDKKNVDELAKKMAQEVFDGIDLKAKEIEELKDEDEIGLADELLKSAEKKVMLEKEKILNPDKQEKLDEIIERLKANNAKLKKALDDMYSQREAEIATNRGKEEPLCVDPMEEDSYSCIDDFDDFFEQVAKEVEKYNEAQKKSKPSDKKSSNEESSKNHSDEKLSDKSSSDKIDDVTVDVIETFINQGFRPFIVTGNVKSPKNRLEEFLSQFEK